MPRSNTKSLYLRILILGFPILVGQLGSIAVGFADTAMVGRYSTDALAAASFVNNLFNMALLTLMGFSFGLTPLAGALFGKHENLRIGSLVRTACLANSLFGVLVASVMAILYFNLHHLGQPPHLLPLIRPYYLIALVGIVPHIIFCVYSQWAYAINRTSMPMWITLSANVINVLGNYALIYGHCSMPELGLTGAGLSTLTARCVGAAAILAVFFAASPYREYRIGFTQGRVTAQKLRHVCSTSLPVALQMFFETSAFSISAVMAGWIGAVALAAFQIITIIGMLGFCIYYSMAAAVSILVANASGQSDNQLMRHTARTGYVIVMGLAGAACLVFCLMGKHMIGIFTSDSAVVSMGVSLLVPLMLYQAADATQILYANALRGTSKVRPMIWIAFVSYLIIGLPSTYLCGFTFAWGLWGIVLSFSISLLSAAVLYRHFFLRAC